MNDHLRGKELFIRFIVCVFRVCLSMFVCASFPFGFEGGEWNLIVLDSDHCLSFYFVRVLTLKAPITTAADDIYKYFIICFRENKT